MKHRQLACWTSAEVAATRPIVAVPVGSCEQHGPHLPLGTDTIVAAALAERLVERLAVPAVVAPALAITSSGEHAGFPGTLSIGASVTAAAVVELARSADWSAGIVLVNGHGGNAAAAGGCRRHDSLRRTPLSSRGGHRSAAATPTPDAPRRR